ncbi:hypothetical protein SAMN05414139_01238 [Burkholderia sp. D7]|nr:hypothetical protein SAMN05414139_01238 [Burkholderia sp. D7]
MEVFTAALPAIQLRNDFRVLRVTCPLRLGRGDFVSLSLPYGFSTLTALTMHLVYTRLQLIVVSHCIADTCFQIDNIQQWSFVTAKADVSHNFKERDGTEQLVLHQLPYRRHISRIN